MVLRQGRRCRWGGWSRCGFGGIVWTAAISLLLFKNSLGHSPLWIRLYSLSIVERRYSLIEGGLKVASGRLILAGKARIVREGHMFLQHIHPFLDSIYTRDTNTNARCISGPSLCRKSHQPPSVYHTSSVSSFLFGSFNSFFPKIRLSSFISSRLCCSSISSSSFDLNPVPNQRRIPVNHHQQSLLRQ